MAQKDNRYEICAELPGFGRDDVHVSVEGNRLQIRAERSTSTETKSDDAASESHKWHRIERRSGAMYRSFTMPTNADLDKITAKAENGVLTVTVPKQVGAATETRKRIAIA